MGALAVYLGLRTPEYEGPPFPPEEEEEDEEVIDVDPYVIIDDNTESDPTSGKMWYATSENFGKHGIQGSWRGNNGVAAYVLRKAGVPVTAANILRYQRLAHCSPYNDALIVKEGEQGRLIKFNSQHHKNYTRMRVEGKPPKQSKGKTGGYRPFFWLPKIKEGAPVPVLATNDDGTSGINPPREILDFGFEGVPPGEYGCDEFIMTASELVG